jgi:hypothetical protein
MTLKHLEHQYTVRNKTGHSQKKSNMRTKEHSIKKTSVRPRQRLPPRSHGVQERTSAVHVILTLHFSHSQFPVDTCKKSSPGDSQRARRRDIVQGMKVLHDGPAKVPVRLLAGGYKGVTGVQMAGICLVLALVMQSGSSALRLGGGSNIGWAARMYH